MSAANGVGGNQIENERVALSSQVWYDVEQGVAIITIDNPPVNALSPEVRDGVQAGLLCAIDDPRADAIVILCTGSTFVAGGDISALGKPPTGAKTRDINRIQEGSPKPVIAAMHGFAFGGGLETTLAAHWRIAARGTVMGLPEVKLGILPGAGGTQRLPCLVGLETALDIIVGGEPLDAGHALEIGLIDEVVDGHDLRAEAIVFARRVVDEELPLRRARDRRGYLAAAEADPDLFRRRAESNADAKRGAEAPLRCIDAIAATVEREFEDGLDFERALTEKLIASAQSRAMRHIFFAERDIWKLPGVPRDLVAPRIGSVCLLSSSRDAVAVGRAFAAAGLTVSFLADDPAAISSADLVMDADFLPPDQLRERLASVAGDLRGDAIVATMAAGQADDLVPAANCLGIHFFYPADERPVVEVIRPAAASAEATVAVLRLLKKMGKKAVVASPAPGAIASRMMTARQRASELAVASGWAPPAEVDAELIEFGFAEGVFGWLDRIGLDTPWLTNGGPGDAMRAALCAAGRTGRASGKGFFDYDIDGNPTASPKANSIIGFEQRDRPSASISEVVLLPVANVAQRLVEDGVALRGSDVDLLCVAAHGWPAWKGGPAFYSEEVVGRERTRAILAEIEAAAPEFLKSASIFAVAAA